MAEHKAERILNAIADKLDGLVTTGQSVKRARAYNWHEDDLPAISIFMGDDTPFDPKTTNIAFNDSTLTVYIESVCADLDYANIETTLNEIRAEVVTALKSGLGLNWVIDVLELGAQQPEISGDGTKPIARQTFAFAVKYRRSVNDPRV